jgi:DNA mismatch endonuclease, patch repair protein
VSEDRKCYHGLDLLRETFQVAEPTARAMRANRATETSPEVRLRRALWAAGLRGYRKNVRRLPGAPDVVFSRVKLCVFVHGCFWHGCERCSRNLKPRTNAAYWQAKVARNRERDRRNLETLAKDGWLAITIWECELKQDLAAFVDRVQAEVAAHRVGLSASRLP